MYNDFVVIGPKSDPASVSGSGNSIRPCRKLFPAAAISPVTRRRQWYKPCRTSPMAEGWLYAQQQDKWMVFGNRHGHGGNSEFCRPGQRYTISDRATWLAFGNKSNHTILFDGDPALFNQYGVIPVSPEKCPTIRYDEARAFRDWLVSAEARPRSPISRNMVASCFFQTRGRPHGQRTSALGNLPTGRPYALHQGQIANHRETQQICTLSDLRMPRSSRTPRAPALM